MAMASEGMHQDAGAKMVHVAPDTSSTIVSKSISRGGGRTSYRGLVQVEPGAKRSKASVVCDALLLDEDSRSDTYPYMDIQEEDSSIGHEATVSKVADDQIFYLMSRGLSEEEAMAMIVRGFIEPIAKELPMEYAVELNRLIELQMEGSIGCASPSWATEAREAAAAVPLLPARADRRGGGLALHPAGRPRRWSAPSRTRPAPPTLPGDRRAASARRGCDLVDGAPVRAGAAATCPTASSSPSWARRSGEHEALVRERLYGLIGFDERPEALNAARWDGGLFVYVPARRRGDPAGRGDAHGHRRRPAASSGAPWSSSRRAPGRRSSSATPRPTSPARSAPRPSSSSTSARAPSWSTSR